MPDREPAPDSGSLQPWRSSPVARRRAGVGHTTRASPEPRQFETHPVAHLPTSLPEGRHVLAHRWPDAMHPRRQLPQPLGTLALGIHVVGHQQPRAAQQVAQGLRGDAPAATAQGGHPTRSPTSCHSSSASNSPSVRMAGSPGTRVAGPEQARIAAADRPSRRRSATWGSPARASTFLTYTAGPSATTPGEGLALRPGLADKQVCWWEESRWIQ